MDAERVLDLLGKPFEGKYVSGAAEWLKNAWDHALRTGESDQPVIIIFSINTPRRTNNRSWSMECIDFLGTTYEEIDKHLKEWGSEIAASRGRPDWAGFGGHGNGGKFHMRQNFYASQFVTYRSGRLTVFGFDSQKRYGFDPHYRGADVAPAKALQVAGVDPDAPYLPDPIRERLKSNDPDLCRFTIVRGVGFRHAQRWRRRETFDELLRSDSQAKQVLDRARVIYVSDDEITDPLKPPTIPSRDGYETGKRYEVPGALPYDGHVFELTKQTIAGTLTLQVAASPFGRHDAAHAIDVEGKHGIVIATYRITELPITKPVGADFIYGVLDCEALDDHGLRQNDRQKLVPNDITDAILEWVASRVDELSNELAEQENLRHHQHRASTIQALTSRLNRWKNRFLRSREIFVTIGPGEGAGEGGTGGGGSGGPGAIQIGSNGGSNGQGSGGQAEGGSGSGEGGGGAGEEKKRGARFPEIRVSGYDIDPVTEEVITLHPRQPVVYQRPEDVSQNLWWINAQRPLAERIVNEDGVNSPRWRDYVFGRFVAVIQAYCVREQWDGTTDLPELLWKLEGEIHDSAAHELDDVLFDPSADSAAGERTEDAEAATDDSESDIAAPR